MRLNELQDKCHKLAVEAGWYEEGFKKTDTEALMLVVTELAEAVECLRKGEEETWADPVTGKLKGLSSEIADAVIRLLDYSAYKKLDLETIIDKKLEYNKTRGIRHGKKF
jgi:NTP pyrophosphatase (non-canonical NTP hydrolase)